MTRRCEPSRQQNLCEVGVFVFYTGLIMSDIPGATLECSWRFQVAEAGCHGAPLSSIFADLGFSVGQDLVESSLSVQMAYLTIFHVGMMAKNTALKVVGFIKGLESGRAAWLLIGPRRASFWEIPEARALGGPTVHVCDGDSCMFATNIPQLTDVRRSCCKLECPHEHTGNMSRTPGLLPLSLFDVLSLALARQITKSQLRIVVRPVSGRLCVLSRLLHQCRSRCWKASMQQDYLLRLFGHQQLKLLPRGALARTSRPSFSSSISSASCKEYISSYRKSQQKWLR